tara:strand:- start:384 stop:578 length:195 start_codon:yes stop_codon:yes gene_type:complete
MELNRLKEIINKPSDYSNKNLEESLQFLSENFEDVKKKLLDLTQLLDFTEDSYNKILEEYKKRK